MSSSQPSLLDTLLTLEHAGWKALSGGDARTFYDAMLTAGAVMLLPVGVMDRDTAINAMASAPPWREYAIADAQAVEVGTGTGAAALIYRATARREGAQQYEAYISSVYVREADSWPLALHQQSPLAA